MKEYFIITQGNLYRDPHIEELQLYYTRQYINLVVLLVGGALLLYSMF